MPDTDVNDQRKHSTLDEEMSNASVYLNEKWKKRDVALKNIRMRLWDSHTKLK